MGRVEDGGFVWWRIYGWLGLIVGVPYMVFLGVTAVRFSGLYFMAAAVGGFINVFILQYSRTAFLWATILSLNPLLWIINGIYLKKRWNHPKVLQGSGKAMEVQAYPTSSDTPLTQDSAPPPPSKPIPPSVGPSNEDFRLAAEEVDRGDYDRGLWERFFAETDGDLGKTRARYVARRAAQIASQ